MWFPAPVPAHNPLLQFQWIRPSLTCWFLSWFIGTAAVQACWIASLPWKFAPSLGTTEVRPQERSFWIRSRVNHGVQGLSVSICSNSGSPSNPVGQAKATSIIYDILGVIWIILTKESFLNMVLGFLLVYGSCGEHTYMYVCTYLKGENLAPTNITTSYSCIYDSESLLWNIPPRNGCIDKTGTMVLLMDMLTRKEELFTGSQP